VTDVITDEALRLLDRYANAGIAGAGVAGYPFYLSVHYTAPHSPWTGHPQVIVDSYDGCPFASCPQEPIHPWARGLTEQHLGNRESLKGYFAAVTAMDANVGRLLDRLEHLGLREETLVVFVSDNGFSCGHHGFWGKGNGTSPRNMYENSIKVPFIVSHPGHVPEARVETAMVSAYDVMPTLLETLGLPIPSVECNLPGQSFAPLLRGEPVAGHECVVIYDEYGPVRMVRTKEWKYVYRHAHGPHELYNLIEDPDERQNLVDEPGQQVRIAELKAMMDEWFARYGDPVRDGLRQDGTLHGQTELAR
jgi:arylsulfatase A-like enzyme